MAKFSKHRLGDRPRDIIRRKFLHWWARQCHEAADLGPMPFGEYELAPEWGAMIPYGF